MTNVMTYFRSLLVVGCTKSSMFPNLRRIRYFQLLLLLKQCGAIIPAVYVSGFQGWLTFGAGVLLIRFLLGYPSIVGGRL